MNLKFEIGLSLGFPIGFVCSLDRAPPRLQGALLVVAMTLGFIAAARVLE